MDDYTEGYNAFLEGQLFDENESAAWMLGWTEARDDWDVAHADEELDVWPE